MPQSQLQSTAKNTNAPPIDSNIDVSIMIGVVVVTIMITVTSSAPCEEGRLTNQSNSNTDELLKIIFMGMIQANDKNEKRTSTSQRTLRRKLKDQAIE